jgi:hypothetical protein
MDAEIKQSVDTQLAAKGLTKTDSDKADLYIGYRTAITRMALFIRRTWARRPRRSAKPCRNTTPIRVGARRKRRRQMAIETNFENPTATILDARPDRRY